VFDDPNLVSSSGLVPVVALAQRAGLQELARAHLSVPGGLGCSGGLLNALLGTVSTSTSAPVIVATRLRKGSANSARGADRLVADAIKTTRSCGVAGLVMLRADSAYYGRDVVAAARRHGVHFSITARKDKAVTATIGAIGEDVWMAIRYPRAVFDEQLQQCVSVTRTRPRRAQRSRPAVPGLAPPRGVHRLAPVDVAG
jgi:hypothetical protein